MNQEYLHVENEIGQLNKVMVHRPSWELERITPRDLEHVLFEDIPWLKEIQKEHDGFASTLRNHGCDVIYFEDCITEVLQNDQAKVEIIDRIIENEIRYDEQTINHIRIYLQELSVEQLIFHLFGGLSVNDLEVHKNSLMKYMPEDYQYYFGPLPNLYFMRDPAAVVGDGLILSQMDSPIRSRESYLMKLLYRYHNIFDVNELYYDSEHDRMSIEGGDILILSREVVCIGCSERTSAFAIETFTKNLFNKSEQYQTILVVQIPHQRSYMHLDTVFTMVDRNKFLIYPEIMNNLKIVAIKRGADNQLSFYSESNLVKALQRHLRLNDVQMILSGGNDPITSSREQWNDSTNALAISPGVVLTYDRNEVTNEILDKHGVKVTSIECGELVRGRGGPRCMSMPLIREDI